MKLHGATAALLVISVLVSPALVAAGSLSIVEGLTADAMSGCRFKGSWGPDVYLGIDDLGVGENRVQADAGNPLPDGTYPVTFTFSSVENAINLTGPGTVSLTWDFDDLGSPESMNWDALVLTLRDSKDNGAVAFQDVVVNGEALGDFGVLDVQGTPGYQHWTITGMDFTQSFTVSADLCVVNLASNEALRAEIWAAEEMLWDWGDAPDSYSTTSASDGPRHRVGSALYLGSSVDDEDDGLPSVECLGDDQAGTDDEDGVVFTSGLLSGEDASAQVTVSAPGLLSMWVDYNLDGDFSDADETVFHDLPLDTGLHSLEFSVPPTAVPGISVARFRVSTSGGLSWSGPASDGEVEDYVIPLSLQQQELDWGDAPDPSYPTLASSNGAAHGLGGPLWLGAMVDAELDGQPTADADGDDLAGDADEDGVTFSGALVPGRTVDIVAVASSDGLLNGWIDFAADGDWDDPEDHIIIDAPVTNGSNDFSVIVPASAANGDTVSALVCRFRVSTVGGLLPTGAAPDGEVEDHMATLAPFWDLNGDGVCDLYDVLQINDHWNEQGEPGWIPEDTDGNGHIDLYDVLTITQHWNSAW